MCINGVKLDITLRAYVTGIFEDLFHVVFKLDNIDIIGDVRKENWSGKIT